MKNTTKFLSAAALLSILTMGSAFAQTDMQSMGMSDGAMGTTTTKHKGAKKTSVKGNKVKKMKTENASSTEMQNEGAERKMDNDMTGATSTETHKETKTKKTSMKHTAKGMKKTKVASTTAETTHN